jgi:hypothetical protein
MEKLLFNAAVFVCAGNFFFNEAFSHIQAWICSHLCVFCMSDKRAARRRIEFVAGNARSI